MADKPQDVLRSFGVSLAEVQYGMTLAHAREVIARHDPQRAALLALVDPLPVAAPRHCPPTSNDPLFDYESSDLLCAEGGCRVGAVSDDWYCKDHMGGPTPPSDASTP